MKKHPLQFVRVPYPDDPTTFHCVPAVGYAENGDPLATAPKRAEALGTKNGLPIYSTSGSDIDADPPIAPVADEEGDQTKADDNADEQEGSDQAQIDQSSAAIVANKAISGLALRDRGRRRLRRPSDRCRSSSFQ